MGMGQGGWRGGRRGGRGRTWAAGHGVPVWGWGRVERVKCQWEGVQ
jgi:hypothetical protein